LFHRNLFGALCIIHSLVFVVIMGIYISVWDRQNLSGWTQFSIFIALFFVFLIHGSTLPTYNVFGEATPSCHFVGIQNSLCFKSNTYLFMIKLNITTTALMAQIFFLAVNTSWSVMCWDLFWTFWWVILLMKNLIKLIFKCQCFCTMPNRKLENVELSLKEQPKRIFFYICFSWVVPVVFVGSAFIYSNTKV